MFDWLIDLVSGAWWTYPLLFAVAYLDAIVPLVPSETLVITAGVLASAGDMELGWIIVFARARRVLRRQHRVLHRAPYGERVEQRFFSSEEGEGRLGGPNTSSTSAGARSSSSPASSLAAARSYVFGRCAGDALAALRDLSTRSPSSSGRRTRRCSATSAASSSRSAPWKGLIVALRDRLLVAGGVELVRWLCSGERRRTT